MTKSGSERLSKFVNLKYNDYYYKTRRVRLLEGNLTAVSSEDDSGRTDGQIALEKQQVLEM